MNLGPTELIIILLIVLLLFGGAKLPKLARSLGDAQKEFKNATQEAKADSAEAKVDQAKAAEPAETVTMTKAELDALLAEREAAARRESPPAG
jgi:sec-independent protein translocase protein TatA